MMQSVTNISFEYLNCCLVCLEELSTSCSNTILPCKRFREKDVVVWMKVMTCFSINMITNSISCLYCIVFAWMGVTYPTLLTFFCIFGNVSLFNEVFSAYGSCSLPTYRWENYMLRTVGTNWFRSDWVIVFKKSTKQYNHFKMTNYISKSDSIQRALN